MVVARTVAAYHRELKGVIFTPGKHERQEAIAKIADAHEGRASIRASQRCKLGIGLFPLPSRFRPQVPGFNTTFKQLSCFLLKIS